MNTLFFCLISFFSLILIVLIDISQYHLSVLDAILRLIETHVGTLSYVLITALAGLIHAIKMDRKHRKRTQSNK